MNDKSVHACSTWGVRIQVTKAGVYLLILEILMIRSSKYYVWLDKTRANDTRVNTITLL